MKKVIGAVSFPMILTLLIGCAEGPPLQTAVLAKPDRRLEIYGVRTYQHKKGVLVTGSVRRPPLFTGAIWGHLHVEGLFDDRRPPIAVDTRWGTLSPRGSRIARFNTVLPTTNPLEIKSVRVEYRSESDRARSRRSDR